ncbi:MAG: putative metal-dependent enzyme (double-stranded beta helix superfamily) [Gammaproteobacteria bacterium]|jgi:predicted metal-dependent enzyme (double-stranded beta helix superfamily)
MFDLDEFVAKCQAALHTPDTTTRIEALVRDAVADPKAVRSAFDARVTGSSISDRAVYRSEELTVLDVSTPVGMKTPVHNHNMWAVIGVYDGEEQNMFFKEVDGKPEANGERLLRTGDIAVLDEKTIHAISNPLARRSYAIHVYGGDLVNRQGRSMWNPTTKVREPYDIKQLSTYTREMMETSA